jgi:nucleotide-binding universal stress UspA family protein
MVSPSNRGKIVVGVDGSPSSVQALRWAARQAQLTGGELHAVTAWRIPTTYGWIPPIADLDWPGNARTALDHAIKEAVDDTQAGLVRRHVIQGHAARALLHAAADADLLVVGSRGHGEFTGMLLGSVAQHVLTHAPCPVLVVRTAAASEELIHQPLDTTDRRRP